MSTFIQNKILHLTHKILRMIQRNAICPFCKEENLVVHQIKGVCAWCGEALVRNKTTKKRESRANTAKINQTRLQGELY